MLLLPTVTQKPSSAFDWLKVRFLPIAVAGATVHLSAMSERWLEVTKRAAIGLAVMWFVAFYFINRDAIHLSSAVGLSSPNSRTSTMCSDMYAPGDSRLSDCEMAGSGGWAEATLARQRGEQVLWANYAYRNHWLAVWLWWFGVPIALLGVTPSLAWVFGPLRELPTQKSGRR